MTATQTANETEAAALFDRIDHLIVATAGGVSPAALARLIRLRARARARWFRRAGYPHIARDLLRGIPAPLPLPTAADRRPTQLTLAACRAEYNV